MKILYKNLSLLTYFYCLLKKKKKKRLIAAFRACTNTQSHEEVSQALCYDQHRQKKSGIAQVLHLQLNHKVDLEASQQC